VTGAIILAAGQGARLGGETPKGLQKLAHKHLFEHSLSAMHHCMVIDRIVVVVPGAEVESLTSAIDRHAYPKLETMVAGGEVRMESVICGIEAFSSTPEWIVVHDAARPLASANLFTQVIESAMHQGSAIAAARVTDTLKQAEDTRITATVDRRQMWQAQTPQVFQCSALHAALTQCISEGTDVTDDAQAMERAGHQVHVVLNTKPNPKITTNADWAYVEHLLKSNS